MQFRITHLLSATAVFALFAAGLSFPNYIVARWFNLGMLLATLLLIVRAICVSGRERKVIICGLVVGAAYLVAVRWYRLPTSAALEQIRPPYVTLPSNFTQYQLLQIQEEAENFASIGQYAFAATFGFGAALVASYWTRPSPSGNTEDWFAGNG